MQGINNWFSGTKKYLTLIHHTIPVLKELRWIPAYTQLQLYGREAIMTFKCMQGMALTYLSLQFVSEGSISGRSIKQSSHLNIPFHKNASAQRTFHYRAVQLWNG